MMTSLQVKSDSSLIQTLTSHKAIEMKKKEIGVNPGPSPLEDIREETKQDVHRARTASSEKKTRSLITGLSVDNFMRNSNFIQNIIKSSAQGSSRLILDLLLKLGKRLITLTPFKMNIYFLIDPNQRSLI